MCRSGEAKQPSRPVGLSRGPKTVSLQPTLTFASHSLSFSSSTVSVGFWKEYDIFSFDCVFYSPLFFVFDQLWISALTTTSPLPQYTHWLDKDISLISENYTSLRVERYKFVCCFDTVSRLFPCPNVPCLLWIEHLLTGMSLCLYGMESRLLGVAQKW